MVRSTFIAGIVLLGGSLALGPGCGSAEQPDIVDLGTGGMAETEDGSGGEGLETFGDGLMGDGGGDSCVDLVLVPEPIGVSMFVTVDKSSSMADDQKWVKTKSAFVSFFTDPGAAGLDVALRFWPDGDCDLSCNIEACAQPQVGMGSLGDVAHVQELIGLFDGKSPDGLTPMESALAGAEQFALAHQAGLPEDQRTVVVLVTDGEPTVCSPDIDTIASYAEVAHDAAGVLTFAVGLEGSSEAQMNTIASAGETGEGYFIGSGNAESELVAALRDIQQVAVACTFTMPESDETGVPVDPSKVNVTHSSDGESALIPQVEVDGCGSAGGWHYDDPDAPSSIVLCPSTCDAVNAGDGQVEIALGCTTVVR